MRNRSLNGYGRVCVNIAPVQSTQYGSGDKLLPLQVINPTLDGGDTRDIIIAGLSVE